MPPILRLLRIWRRATVQNLRRCKIHGARPTGKEYREEPVVDLQTPKPAVLTLPVTTIITPRRPTESEARIQMDPIQIRWHPRPPGRSNAATTTRLASRHHRAAHDAAGRPAAAPPNPTLARRSSRPHCPAPAKTRRMGRSPAAAQPARLRPAALGTAARRERGGGGPRSGG